MSTQDSGNSQPLFPSLCKNGCGFFSGIDSKGFCWRQPSTPPPARGSWSHPRRRAPPPSPARTRRWPASSQPHRSERQLPRLLPGLLELLLQSGDPLLVLVGLALEHLLGTLGVVGSSGGLVELGHGGHHLLL